MKQTISKNRWAFLGITLGVIALLVGVAVYAWPEAEESIDWEITLIGSDGQQQVLDYDEIRDMPSEEANGGFFTTVGVVNGPFRVKGVLLQDLCDLVGGITTDDIVSISATDGYSMVFDYDQIFNGTIQTYDPVTIYETPHEKQVILLTYKQDGETIPYSDGRPLRLAVVGSESLLTEGHNWVKWVNKIEVIKID